MMLDWFAKIPTATAAEEFSPLFAGGAFRVERIVSQGHASPEGFWYDQDEHEWVLLLQGSARLEFEDRCVDLKPGQSIDIPAHVKHRVAWTTPHEPTIWLAIHYRDRA
ncbi:MAG: cupin domain-containing protein [Gemmataceae bacterium]